MTKLFETIDSIPNDTLAQVIVNSNNYTWNFFALKIILTRLKLKLSMYNDDNEVLAGCCDELRNLLKKSVNVPNSQTDLKQILSLVSNIQDT